MPSMDENFCQVSSAKLALCCIYMYVYLQMYYVCIIRIINSYNNVAGIIIIILV